MRTAVVTGANRGIGFAVAQRLGELGHRVVLVCRDRDRGQAARAALGGAAELVVADLGSVPGIHAAAGRIAAACPDIDVLVHNAGIWPTRARHSDGLEQSFVTSDDDVDQRALDLGATAYLKKPVKADRLLEVVRLFTQA